MVGEKTHEKVTELNFLDHECLNFVRPKPARPLVLSIHGPPSAILHVLWEPIMSATRVLLEQRAVSGIGEQGTDQEPICIEKIQLSILDYARRRPSEGISVMSLTR